MRVPRAGDPSSCLTVLLPWPSEAPLASQSVIHDAILKFSAGFGSPPGPGDQHRVQRSCSGHLTPVACSSPPAATLRHLVWVLLVQNLALREWRNPPRWEARATEGRGSRHGWDRFRIGSLGLGSPFLGSSPPCVKFQKTFLRIFFFLDFVSPLERRDNQSVGVRVR